MRRDAELVIPERLMNTHAIVVGCGAIGRQVAIQLGTMEVGDLTLIDHDVVEPVNRHNQGWFETDLGCYKVDALSRLLGHVNTRYIPHEWVKGETHVFPIPARYGTRQEYHHPSGKRRAERVVVFCCVDNIETRKRIFEDCREWAGLFLDARMAAEFCQAFAVWDDRSRDYYPSTLFSEEETYAGRCATQNTIYSSSVAAGILCHQFARWLRGGEPDLHVELNMLAATYKLEQPVQTYNFPDSDLLEGGSDEGDGFLRGFGGRMARALPEGVVR